MSRVFANVPEDRGAIQKLKKKKKKVLDAASLNIQDQG